jgi:Na+/H+ antiporter NhaD/arsenite permease-like protein
VVLDTLSAWRVISPRQDRSQHDDKDDPGNVKVKPSPFVRLNFPMNFVTAPLIADLFLLAILAIGRQEVHDGTLGANNISPIDIMVFFLSLAYIAISIDASGLIRYLAFKVLEKGGENGPRLFFYLYSFFFGLGTFIGNDPIILSGTAFIAYMTRVSSNINHPRAWIHTQFAVANTASAILVSSNPTNLVLAGAFQIKFVEYTANMIVPVVITAIVLFPFLLYVVFADKKLIPSPIEMHELPKEAKKPRVNPNIPFARSIPYPRRLIKEQENQLANEEQSKLLLLNDLNEIIDPFLDKKGAMFGALIMATTLSVLLGLNAASQSTGEHPVFWVTLPAAFVMFCWDVVFGWYNRHETRKIAHEGRQFEEEKKKAKQAALEQEERDPIAAALTHTHLLEAQLRNQSSASGGNSNTNADDEIMLAADSTSTRQPPPAPTLLVSKKQELACSDSSHPPQGLFSATLSGEVGLQHERGPSTLVSLVEDAYKWSQETFPTVTAVVAHLPFALVPFALSMFVLVQALVTKGWVSVFAYGWDYWVNTTGTLGAIGSMAFLSVILCNVSFYIRMCG